MAEDFGPYRLESLLGRGGMGEVWRAVDTSHDDRVVALKLLGSWLSDDEAFARRFRRESALAAKVTSPHMISVHRYGDIDGKLFIDMQLVDGLDLGTLLDRSGPLSPERAVEIISQTGKALDTAHRARLLHRDVKPSNILVTSDAGDDHAYLIDFGIARAVEDTRLSASEAVIGTLAYMAPERFAGDGDHRADIYALGCVLHQALTGHAPFTTTNPLHLLNAHQNLPAPSASAMRPGVPAALDEVIARAMAKNPDHRYNSAAELAQAARRALVPAGAASQSSPVAASTTPVWAYGQPAGAPPAGGQHAAGQPWYPQHPTPPPHSAPGPTPPPAGGYYPTPPPSGPPPGQQPPYGSPYQPYFQPQPAARPAGPPQRSGSAGNRGLTIAIVAGILAVGVVVIVFMLVNRPGQPAAPGGGGGGGTPTEVVQQPLPERVLSGHDGDVLGVATAELDGRPVIVSGSADYSVRMWDPATGAPIGRPMVGHTDYVRAVATTVLNGRPVAVSASDDDTLIIWDLATQQQVGAPLTGHTDWVRAVTITQLNGRQVAVSGSDDQTVRVWDLATQQQVGPPLTGHTDWILSISAIESGGRTFAVSGAQDDKVLVWDLTAQALAATLTGHTGDVRGVTTTVLDGRPVAISASDDNTLIVWDLTTNTQVGAALEGHTDWVKAVTVTELDGRPVAISSSDDQTVRVWDLATHQQIGQPFTGHSDYVDAVTTLQLNGRPLVVSGAEDDNLRTWDLISRTGG